jgi:hypothetical protein
MCWMHPNQGLDSLAKLLMGTPPPLAMGLHIYKGTVKTAPLSYLEILHLQKGMP